LRPTSRYTNANEGCRADDVGVLRAPRVGARAVVALYDEAAYAVAADDAVDHLRAGHRIALRHAVRDDVADSIARVALDEHHVAGVVDRLHALSGDEHVAGSAAERLRPEEHRPEHTRDDDEHDRRDLPDAREPDAQCVPVDGRRRRPLDEDLTSHS
jgi:GAF domain-containing protein